MSTKYRFVVSNPTGHVLVAVGKATYKKQDPKLNGVESITVADHTFEVNEAGEARTWPKVGGELREIDARIITNSDRIELEDFDEQIKALEMQREKALWVAWKRGARVVAAHCENWVEGAGA
jgi:hypothetical protein